MPRTDFDLVVVGAGFAGLVCARAAAERGLRVAVIDRKTAPGTRLHTTGIVVKEAAEELRLPPGLTARVRGVRLYNPALRAVDLDSPGYYFLATDTAGVLRWLSEQAAAAGVEVIFGQAFAGARREGDAWTLDGSRLRARYLVGADGPRSAVAQALGLGRNGPMLVGVEAEFEGLAGVDPDRLHCFLDSHLAPGYIGWAVPGLGMTQIGLACRQGHKPDLHALVDRLARVFDFSAARIAGRRSGPIPVGGLVRPFSAEGVLLVGDAAGLVSPLTAGGIHPAFRYGKRAGQVIADHLLDGGADPGAVLDGEYPRYRWKALLRRALDRDPPNWLYDRALGLAPVRAAARLVYFHRKGLKSAAAWRDLFGRR